MGWDHWDVMGRVLSLLPPPIEHSSAPSPQQGIDPWVSPLLLPEVKYCPQTPLATPPCSAWTFGGTFINYSNFFHPPCSRRLGMHKRAGKRGLCPPGTFLGSPTSAAAIPSTPFVPRRAG